MIVKFIKTRDPESGYEIENLTINKEYEVIGIEADDYRIIDDNNEPILFPPDCFEIVNRKKPSFWETTIGEGGEEYSYPPNWNDIGFFEDYFDGVKNVKDEFWKDYYKYYQKTAANLGFQQIAAKKRPRLLKPTLSRRGKLGTSCGVKVPVGRKTSNGLL